MKKAWLKTDCDGVGKIIFDEQNLESDDIERAEEFDKYADQGFVPPLVLLKEHDWWHECFFCGNEIGYDIDDCDMDKIVGDAHQIFCNMECQKNLNKEIESINQKNIEYEKEFLDKYGDIFSIREPCR